MKKLGIVGFRGMVGSVLMDRMTAEGDFKNFSTTLFSNGLKGQTTHVDGIELKIEDALNFDLLKDQDIIITCQGSEYTQEVYPGLRKSGWNGYWIDAASELRMKDDALICLDTVNEYVLKDGIKNGIKTFVGGNCTVSLMLMGLGQLVTKGHVEWISSMTYQAASGAGAKHMQELLKQMGYVYTKHKNTIESPSANILDLERNVTTSLQDSEFPKTNFTRPLALNLIPWIDKAMEGGHAGKTKEEWKGGAEANKILQTKNYMPVDGLCVRVSSMRCHAQGLTIKLKKDIPLNEVEAMIAESHNWIDFVPNKFEEVNRLTPALVSGKLTIATGRVRKLDFGPEYLTAFTIGDQLLWGAAEPLRRMLKFL